MWWILLIITIVLASGVYYFLFSSKDKKGKMPKESKKSGKTAKEKSDVEPKVKNGESAELGGGELIFNENGAEDYGGFTFDEDGNVIAEEKESSQVKHIKFDSRINPWKDTSRYKSLSDMFDDDDLFGFEEVGQDDDKSEIVKEINKMSPKMKAILFTSALDRKDF